MSFNTFGRLFRVTTWGESHGPAIGCVVDGVPPGIVLSEGHIQPFLDRRRPGRSAMTSQRRETDEVEILSGVFEGQTTGHPIALIIHNRDARSRDYDSIKDLFRPGHADYTYFKKYGIRDYRGGGRASARETAMRVAAGAIARRILGENITIRAGLAVMGEAEIEAADWDWEAVKQNPCFAPAKSGAEEFEKLLKAARKAGDSLGGIVHAEASGIPVGLGAPHYAKLDAELAGAFMSIHAAKGVEIGSGFAMGRGRGSEMADGMRAGPDGTPEFLSNHAGGILGGISTGAPIVARVAFKPASSIPQKLKTIDTQGKNQAISTGGRHDPCVAIRAVPVVEAMMALTLADHMLLHRAQTGGG